MDAGQNQGPVRARFCLALRRLILVLAVAALPGCALTTSSTVWHPPLSPPPLSHFDDAAFGPLTSIEANFSRGIDADKAGDPACLDFYYAAAVEAWPLHATCAAAPIDAGSEYYRASVRKLLDAAARYNRFDSAQGITVSDGQRIPIRYFGFLWQPQDFHCMLPVGTYASKQLPRRYASPGVGVDYVVLTSEVPRQPFIKSRQPFAATAVLKPAGQPAVASPNAAGFSLDFYDPLRAATADNGLPITRDITAPIAYDATQEGDAWLEGFIRPSEGNGEANLFMTQPFQPNKIPIVLVHGLASSPLTWAHLENDLRAQTAIMNRYQLWVFRYDTGDPFLASAAALRRQLTQVRQTYDPYRTNPNFSRMVLIGHSLGGLVSKLQVTYATNTLWDSAAKQPFNTIRTDPMTQAQLYNSFFFSPSPDVSRVIYIATPHRGSMYAGRCVGRVGSALVVEQPEWAERHAQLVRDNPDAFRYEMRRGIPTSIDLLEPSSEILQATDRLQYRQGVPLHSIIGDDRWTCAQGRGDGVVAVRSAQLGGVQSELFVDASHTEIQQRTETSQEVIRILQLHAAQP
jgi:pimeloyl-ACP methyl ester carboxylesterase